MSDNTAKSARGGSETEKERERVREKKRGIAVRCRGEQRGILLNEGKRERRRKKERVEGTKGEREHEEERALS